MNPMNQNLRNHHASAAPLTCAEMELLLPILAESERDDTSMAAARSHLATCAHCQREQQAYLALDQAVRDRFGLSSVRPYTTEDIMLRLRATERAEHSDDTVSVPHESRPTSRFNQRALRPWLSGLGAVAVVAVLLGRAAMLFSGRLGFGVGSGGPPRYTFAGTQGIFADVSMVSPTEGWALAQLTKTPSGKSSDNTVTFYHYQNGTWTPIHVSLSNSAIGTLREGGPGGFNGTISMDSSTDGWATASNFNRGSVLFHYSNGQWQEVPGKDLSAVRTFSPHSVWAIAGWPFAGQQSATITHYDGTSWIPQTIADVGDRDQVVQLQMASDTLGWALVYKQEGLYQIAQYAGNNSWTTHSTLNVGGLGNIDGLAMTSPDDGWAIGQRLINGPDSVTADRPVPQVLYHYTGGKWQSAPMQFNDGVTFVTLQKIVMRSAHDGWIIAQDQNQRPGITASGIETHTILLHYDGTAWTEVQEPNVGGDASEITGMAFAGESGWACGYVAALPPGKTIEDGNQPAYGSPMLWSYHDGQWSLYQQK